MTYFSSVLFTSSLLFTASLVPVVNPLTVSANPGLSTPDLPAIPTVSEGENATSPQIKPGISPGQPVKPRIRYECKNEADKLSTVAHTERGMIELIVWESNFFGTAWTPAKRCEAVTQRFQQFSDQRLLKFVSTGSMNNYKVICISEQAGQCLEQGLLITLEPKDRPTRVLRQLFNYRTSIRRGGPKKEVIDFERLLNERTPIAEPESAIGGTTESPVGPTLDSNN